MREIESGKERMRLLTVRLRVCAVFMTAREGRKSICVEEKV